VTTRFTRDANGDTTLLRRRIESTPLGPVTREFTATYDAQRNPLGITDNLLSGTTSFSYQPPFVDGAPAPTYNQPLTLIEPRNQAVSGDRDTNFAYSGPNLASVSTPGGRTTTLAYPTPTDGLPESQTDVFGRVTQFTYHPTTRNLTSATRGADLATGLRRTTSFGYTSEGYVDTITDAVNRVLDFDYDPMGRVTKLTLPDLRAIDFGYDDKGNLTSINPPGTLAGLHEFRRDERDREDLYTPPAVGGPVATSFEYNRENQLTKIIRPDSQQLLLNYQPTTGKLASIVQPGGSYTLTYKTTPANQATGLLDSVSENFTGGAMSFAYVHGDRLGTTTWTGPVAGSVSQTYLADGLLGTQSVNGANSVSFAYDKDGLITGAGAMTLSREAATGFLQSATLAGFGSTARSRNDFGELSSEITGTHYSVSYPNRDKLGRVTQKIETLGGVTTTTDYSYDAAGRLFQVFENGFRAREYAYDANSNRTSLTHFGPDGVTIVSTETGIADAQDRLTSYHGATYAYTANGELSTKTEAGQTTSYGYDLLGNLRSVNLPDGRTLTYVIDGANRRIGKRINGTAVQGFLYGDQLEPVAELDGSNNLVSRFVYGSKANVPDYLVKGGETFRILSDQLGSVRLVVSTTGIVRQRIDYDEFGRITSRQEFDSGGNLLPATTPPFQPFGFAGGIYDPDTGLTRFGARDYDPSVGRWTSKDPIRFAGDGVNLYGYVLDDPVNAFDPSGLLSLPKPRQPGETFLECLDRSAKEFYGEAVALADTNAPLSLAGLGGLAAEQAVTSATEFGAEEAVKNARIAEALAEGSRLERAAEGFRAAEKIGRVRVLAGALKSVSGASGLIGAASFGFSVGARAAFISSCQCPE
jgi:RHS repeat-associated protein